MRSGIRARGRLIRFFFNRREHKEGTEVTEDLADLGGFASLSSVHAKAPRRKGFNLKDSIHDITFRNETNVLKSVTGAERDSCSGVISRP